MSAPPTAADPSADRSSSDSGAAGSAAAIASSGPGRRSIGTTTPPTTRNARNRTFARARTVSGPERPGEEQAEARERRPCRAGPPTTRSQRRAAAARRPAEDEDRRRDEQGDLDRLDDQHGQQPGDDQLGTAERRPAEPLQDPVRAVVGGRDPEADEARRDDPERDRAGQEEVHRPAGRPSAGSRSTRTGRGRASGSRSSRRGSRRAAGRGGAPSRSIARDRREPGAAPARLIACLVAAVAAARGPVPLRRPRPGVLAAPRRSARGSAPRATRPGPELDDPGAAIGAPGCQSGDDRRARGRRAGHPVAARRPPSSSMDPGPAPSPPADLGQPPRRGRARSAASSGAASRKRSTDDRGRGELVGRAEGDDAAPGRGSRSDRRAARRRPGRGS